MGTIIYTGGYLLPVPATSLLLVGDLLVPLLIQQVAAAVGDGARLRAATDTYVHA